MIEHTDDDVIALRELRRVTRPGGHLVVSVPAHPRLWSRHDEANHHYRRYSRTDLRTAAIDVGWQLHRMTSFNSLLLAPAAAVRVAQRQLQRWRRDNGSYTPDVWSIAKYGQLFVDARDLGLELKSVVRPDETFYLWGVDPGVYYYADRRPASGIMWVHRLVYGPFQERWSTHVLNDLERTRPVLFIAQLPMEGKQDHPILVWASEHYVPARKFQRGRKFFGFS